ncbi:MAG: hypothetical protein Q8L48_39285 [Archangium sp.]|nr:hypothetical protein [Archangium sp.]
MIENILRFLPLAGAAAIILLAQTQVRERSEKASLALSIGAGLEAAFLLARYFIQSELLWAAGPLVQVASVGAVVFGLITLVDELNPKRPGAMPPLLAGHKEAAPNLFLRYFFGFFGLVAVLSTGLRGGGMIGAAVSLVAIGATLAGSVWVERQGPLGRWVLERRPELVVWSYVHSLRVVNRKTGSSTTHWSAQLGLSTGALVPLPAMGEQQAQALVMAVMERCPGVVLGFSPENVAKFKSTPEAMRGASALSAVR